METVWVALGEASIILTFSASVFGKIRQRQSAAVAIANFIPAKVTTRSLLPTVVVAELAVVVCFLLGNRSIGAALSAALLATFTAVLLPYVARGQRVACHCFGSSSNASWAHISFNLVGLGISLLLLVADMSPIPPADLVAAALFVGPLVPAGRLLVLLPATKATV